MSNKLKLTYTNGFIGYLNTPLVSYQKAWRC